MYSIDGVIIPMAKGTCDIKLDDGNKRYKVDLVPEAILTKTEDGVTQSQVLFVRISEHGVRYQWTIDEVEIDNLVQVKLKPVN